MLTDAIADQDILGTITIELNSEEVEDSIGNIPFLGAPKEQQAAQTGEQRVRPVGAARPSGSSGCALGDREQADAPAADKAPDPAHQVEPYLGEPTYLQLQYSQSVILVFNEVLWPHITVGTLTLSAG